MVYAVYASLRAPAFAYAHRRYDPTFTCDEQGGFECCSSLSSWHATAARRVSLAAAQPKAKAAPKQRARRKVELQDVAALKQQKDTLKKELKELYAHCRMQMQKRRRLLKRAGNLDADGHAWLQEQAQLKRAENRAWCRP